MILISIIYFYIFFWGHFLSSLCVVLFIRRRLLAVFFGTAVSLPVAKMLTAFSSSQMWVFLGLWWKCGQFFSPATEFGLLGVVIGREVVKCEERKKGGERFPGLLVPPWQHTFPPPSVCLTGVSSCVFERCWKSERTFEVVIVSSPHFFEKCPVLSLRNHYFFCD